MTSNRSIDPNTVQVMVRVVAVRVVTWRLLTGPGGVASERVVTAMVGVVGGAIVGRAGEKQN